MQGTTRADALDRMRAALDSYVIRGVGHNIPFMRDLIDQPRFTEGRITTQYIREEYPEGFHGGLRLRCDVVAMPSYSQANFVFGARLPPAEVLCSQHTTYPPTLHRCPVLQAWFSPPRAACTWWPPLPS